jgi:hypothetical protein
MWRWTLAEDRQRASGHGIIGMQSFFLSRLQQQSVRYVFWFDSAQFLGYGNLSCKTPQGRVATIIYGLFGIPLMLFLLNSIGQVMFSSVEVLWKQAKKWFFLQWIYLTAFYCRKLKRKTRRVRKQIMAGIKSSGKFYMAADKPESTYRQNTDATVSQQFSALMFFCLDTRRNSWRRGPRYVWNFSCLFGRYHSFCLRVLVLNDYVFMGRLELFPGILLFLHFDFNNW